MNPKIAGKWMFIPLELIIIGFGPPPYQKHCKPMKKVDVQVKRLPEKFPPFADDEKNPWISCAGRLRKTASVQREALAVRGSGSEGEVNSLFARSERKLRT